MYRFTNKSSNGRYTHYEQKTNEDYDYLVEKLGKLEDIEEELGIDLYTLFKVRQIYWRIRYMDTNEYSEVKKSDRIYLDLQNRDLKVYEEYDDFGFDLDLKDYGKTWSLDKSDLVCEIVKKEKSND